MGPCLCGAFDCPSCGRAQGTYYLYHTRCDSCKAVLADCDCEEPSPEDDLCSDEDDERYCDD
jgi:hypothetical protein